MFLGFDLVVGYGILRDLDFGFSLFVVRFDGGCQLVGSLADLFLLVEFVVFDVVCF